MQLFCLFPRRKVAYEVKVISLHQGGRWQSFRIPEIYQEKFGVSGYKHVGIWHCVFCMPIPLRVCLAKALTKRNPFFLINYASSKTYQFLFFFCCRAVMRITRLCGRTLLINASTFILFFGTITIFRFSILRIA